MGIGTPLKLWGEEKPKLDCSPASFLKIPKVPTPKCGTIPESGAYKASHGESLKGPVPLKLEATKTQGNIQVSECGKSFLFLQGGQKASFKRSHVSQEGKSHYIADMGQLRFALDAITNITLVGKITGGMFERDVNLQAVEQIPLKESKSIKKCFCAEVAEHLKQRKGDQNIYKNELKLGKKGPKNTRIPWNNDEGITYQVQVTEVIQKTNRPQSFTKMVENRPSKSAGPAGMITNYETCHIETHEKNWENKECFAPIDWIVSYQHELIHKKTCCEVERMGEKHWERERAKHTETAEGLANWEAKHPKYKTFKGYMSDPIKHMLEEFKAYQVTIELTDAWLKENCQ